MKRILAVALSLVILFSVPTHVYAEKVKTNGAVTRAPVEVTTLGDRHELVYYEGVLIEDITTDEYRKIINTSGTDISVYYEDLSTGIATLSLNGSVIETYNMVELRNDYDTWIMPEEDKVLLNDCLSKQIGAAQITLPSELQNKYIVTYEDSGATVIRPSSNTEMSSVRAAYTIVRPNGPVTDTYPEYSYREVDSKLQYSSYCSRYLDMSIKDSMHQYSQTKKTSYKYAAMTVVSVISGALKIASSTLINSLIGLTTVVNGVLKLSTNVEYYFSETYTFHALRQAYIYDYTNFKRDVSVKTTHGTGEISLSWDYQNNEYVNPSYRITGIAYPFTVAYTTLYEEALEIWEYNMYIYGYWSLGDI